MVSLAKFLSVVLTMTFLDLVYFEYTPVADFMSDYSQYYEEYFASYVPIDFLGFLH